MIARLQGVVCETIPKESRNISMNTGPLPLSGESSRDNFDAVDLRIFDVRRKRDSKLAVGDVDVEGFDEGLLKSKRRLRSRGPCL